MQFLKKYPATIILTLLSIFLLVISLEGYIDFIRTLLYFKEYESDEFFLAIIFILSGLILDYNTAQLKYHTEIQKQKLYTIQATVQNARHIVNDFLHNIQLIDVEASNHLSDESRLLLNEIITDASKRMNGLDELTAEEVDRDKKENILPVILKKKRTSIKWPFLY